MSKKFRKAGRKTLSVFLSASTVLVLSGSAFVPQAAIAQVDQTSLIQQLQAQIAALQAQIAALIGSGLPGGGTTTGGVSCNFTRGLEPGSEGEDVRCLQQYLNSAGFQVSATGAGSPGNESTYYGPRTQEAVGKWQEANNIPFGSYRGYFGPKSQAAYKTMAGTPPPPGTPGTVPPPSAGTGLTVTKGTQPAARLAVTSGINIPFTTVIFTASADGDVTIDSLTVAKSPSAPLEDAAIAGIVLLDENGLRINDVPKALSSTHQAIISDDIVVKAGQSRTITIAADMATSLTAYAGQVAAFDLTAVNTSATINGTLPISGTGQTVNASLTIGGVTLTKGSLDPGASRTKEVGTTDYYFTAIKATANSVEDVVWKSIKFNQSGSASANDLENLVAVVDSTEYPLMVSSSGKYYTANLGNGIKIEKGKNKEVSVKGDIKDGSGRTVDFDIFRYSDVVFHGQTFGYDIQPTATNSTDSSTDDDGTFQNTNPVWDAYEAFVNQGNLTISKHTSVASQNVASDADGVPLAAFEFEAKGEPITFTQWVITIATTGTGADEDLTNLTVFDQNGSAIAGPQDAVMPTGGLHNVTFTDSVTIPVGKNIYTVKGDLDSGFDTNDTIVLSFNPSTQITSVTGDVTGNTVTPSPGSTVTGPTMTVKAGSVTISRSGAFASTTKIANGTDVEVGRYVLDGTGSGSDAKITIAKLVKRTNSGNTLSRLVLKDITDPANPIKLTSGSNEVTLANNIKETLTFNIDSDKDLSVPKGTSKILGLFADINSSATTGSYYQFNLHDGATAADWTVKSIPDSNDVSESALNQAAGGVTLQSKGGYEVLVNSSQPSEKWYPDQSTGVIVNVFDFHATSEDIWLTDLRLQLDRSGTTTGAEISKLTLESGGQNILTKLNPSFQNGIEDIDFTTGEGVAGSFKIPKDEFREMTIKLDLPAIGLNQPGKAGRLLGVDYDGAGASSNQKGTGVDSGSTIVSSTHSDKLGFGIVPFAAVPTVERIALTNTDFASGPQTLYKFKVSAEGGPVGLHKFTFKISTSGGVTKFGTTAPSLTLWDDTLNKKVGAATGTVASHFTNKGHYDATDSLVVRIYADTTDLTNAWVEVPVGTPHTFSLRADNILTDGVSDSVVTRLLGDTARTPRFTLTGANTRTIAKVSLVDTDTRAKNLGLAWSRGAGANVASSSSFIWSDLSSKATTSQSLNTGDWVNGFKVNGLPNTGLDASALSN